MVYPEFIGPSYTSQSRIADAELTMNLYHEVMEVPGAKSRAVLYPTPGSRTLTTAATGPGRALVSQRAADGTLGGNPRIFGVAGFGLYEYFYNAATGVWTNTSRGVVAADALPATIVGSGDGGGQLFITSGDKGYCYDLDTNTLTLELSSGATMCDFIDGFFLVLDATSSTLRISGLYDGTTWDPTQIAQRSQAPDPWVSMKVIHGEIWLLGTQTSEVWFNNGDPVFPFAPNQGAFLEFGTGASFTNARLGSSLTWFSANDQGGGIVLRSNGWSATRVSNHALEYAISQMSTTTDAVAYTYQDQGHEFYVLTFPTANQTWVYDAATNSWHQRGHDNGDTTFSAWRPLWHAFVFGQHITQDLLTGDLLEISIDLYTDAGDVAIRRVRRAPHLNEQAMRIFYSGFQLDMQVGIGTPIAPGATPVVSLRTSNDGGRTWSSYRDVSAGAMGAYATRVRWNQLGSARDRVFEISMSDPVPWRIVNAYLTPDPVLGDS